jgi:hypothetical protein
MKNLRGLVAVMVFGWGVSLLAAQESTKIISQDEPRDFLLLGFQLSPKASGLASLWVVSEGGDFPLFGPLLGGYEIGMFHRADAGRLEYRFKTFFNFKLELFGGGKIGAYLGAGGGLFEILRTETYSSGLKFAVGAQGIVGLRFGPPVMDKFIVELQIIRTDEPNSGTRIHILAGARF